MKNTIHESKEDIDFVENRSRIGSPRKLEKDIAVLEIISQDT